MRINGRDSLEESAAEAGRAAGAPKLDSTGVVRSPAVPANVDHVELSAALASLSQTAAVHDAQRAARVQALTTQYQNGQYQSDSHATAQAMLEQGLAA